MHVLDTCNAGQTGFYNLKVYIVIQHLSLYLSIAVGVLFTKSKSQTCKFNAKTQLLFITIIYVTIQM